MSRPSNTTAYVAVVIGAALGLNIAVWLIDFPRTPDSAAAPAAIFACLLLLLEWRPLPSLSQPRLLVFSWTFAFALLFFLPLPLVLAICGGSVVASQVAKRTEIQKILFNAAHLQLAVAAGWGVGSLIADPFGVANGAAVGPRWIAGSLTICAVGIAVSSVLVGIVIGLHQGVPVGRSVIKTFQDNAETDGPLLVLTPVFVVVGVYGPLLLPLLMVASWIVVNSSTRALRNEQEAAHDELTGLPNRRGLNTIGAQALEASIRADRPLAVVQIDLDGFKDVNDRLGHKFGDGVLKSVAERLSQRKRSNDHLFRLGGDEFALVLGGCDAAAARAYAHSCLSEIEIPMTIDGIRVAISGSLGVSSFPDDGDDLATLLHSADLAMYLAKRTRSGVEVFSDGVGPLEDKVHPVHNDFRPSSDNAVQ